MTSAMRLQFKLQTDFLTKHMPKTNSEIIDQLKKATDGLLFISESESAWEIFLWESPPLPITPEKICQHTNHPQYTPVQVKEVDDFFKVATTAEDWHELAEKESVAKYQTLVEILKTHLTNLQVYRFGDIEIDVYVVGQTPSGDLAGITTQVVET